MKTNINETYFKFIQKPEHIPVNFPSTGEPPSLRLGWIICTTSSHLLSLLKSKGYIAIDCY